MLLILKLFIFVEIRFVEMLFKIIVEIKWLILFLN